jgi:hypothetical protein
MGAMPAAARAISAATTDAVAGIGDPVAFSEAVGRLSTSDPQRVSLVLGGVVRALLEERHPDGMDGEDVRAVLTRCTVAGRGWQSEVDPEVLLVVLAGALGLSDPDDRPAPAPAAVARNAVLLTADLLGPRPLGPYLAAALAELARAETIEMP